MIKRIISILTLLTFLSTSVAYGAEYKTFIHTDNLGSPIAATDENGNKLWEEIYYPYGGKRLNQAVSKGNNVYFTGKVHDEALGLTYMNARYYDPAIGRFMSVDPVRFTQQNMMSFNRYAYANNNPTRFIDPHGTVPVDTIWDAGNIVYDLGKISAGFLLDRPDLVASGSTDLAADVGAFFIPYVPAGVTKLSVKVTKGAGKGLETRGVRPGPGERTIQGQVDAATKGGNPTIQRGGQDLVRLRSSGHGQAGATATPQNVRNVTPDGRVFTGKGADRAVTPRDIRELHKAQTGQGTSTIRTRSGR